MIKNGYFGRYLFTLDADDIYYSPHRIFLSSINIFLKKQLFSRIEFPSDEVKSYCVSNYSRVISKIVDVYLCGREHTKMKMTSNYNPKELGPVMAHTLIRLEAEEREIFTKIADRKKHLLDQINLLEREYRPLVDRSLDKALNQSKASTTLSERKKKHNKLRAAAALEHNLAISQLMTFIMSILENNGCVLNQDQNVYHDLQGYACTRAEYVMALVVNYENRLERLAESSKRQPKFLSFLAGQALIQHQAARRKEGRKMKNSEPNLCRIINMYKNIGDKENCSPNVPKKQIEWPE